MTALQPGDVLWALDLSTNPLPAKPPAGITWTPSGPDGEPCIAVDADATGKSWCAEIPLDVVPMRGMQVVIEADIKMENVTQPSSTWAGVMAQLAFDSATRGTVSLNKGNICGTADWDLANLTADVTDDATHGRFFLGLTLCSGKAWIKNVRIRLLRRAAVWPAVDPAPSFRTHTPMRGVMLRGTRFVSDFTVLKGWNVNLVSWQLYGSKTTASDDDATFQAWLNGCFQDLDLVLSNALLNGMKVNIVMQTPVGGRDSTTQAMLLFSDARLQERFVEMWRQIASHCAGRNQPIYAYDLLSEPVQEGFVAAGLKDWLNIQLEAARAIRQVDHDTPIIFQVDGFDGAANFKYMSVVDIPNVIYEVHMYTPHSFTHQGIYKDWGAANGDPVVTYPGTENGTPTGKPLNKDSLKASLKPVRDFQLANRVPIFVGEFSAARWAPGADQYLADVISIFEEYGWDWSYFTYREAPVWSLETADLPYGILLNPVPSVPTARFKAVQFWFNQNQSPY